MGKGRWPESCGGPRSQQGERLHQSQTWEGRCWPSFHAASPGPALLSGSHPRPPWMTRGSQPTSTTERPWAWEGRRRWEKWQVSLLEESRGGSLREPQRLLPEGPGEGVWLVLSLRELRTKYPRGSVHDKNSHREVLSHPGLLPLLRAPKRQLCNLPPSPGR